MQPIGRLNTWRNTKNITFTAVCQIAAALGVLILVVLLVGLWQQGNQNLDKTLFTSYPSSNPKIAGAWPAIMGSVWIVAITALVAVPVGIAAAVYLEEYQRKKTWLLRVIQINISNLAGVPSIVYGLLGLALFVRQLALGRSILAGSLTMALLVLPMVIIISQEALRAVPKTYRESSLALGATEWQTISRQVLPAAMPGIFTGIILSISRAIGETAPLMVIGAAVFIMRAPRSPMEKFTVLPIQIFNWAGEADKAFHPIAGSAIIVLMGVLLGLNSIAIFLRARQNKKQS
jgi:phosphate transport system permease protein